MSFDQFQRYKTVQIMVEKLKKKLGLSQVSVLEIGSNGQCNLGEVLPEERIQYSCLEIPPEREGDDRFIQLDGTNMPQVKTGAYDVVIALDVFEHVPEEKRKAFLQELYRVADKLAILCFPFANGSNELAERRANSYYKAIYGKNHIWLEEHIENGLPGWSSTEAFLTKEGIAFANFEHGDIHLWEEWMKALFGAYDVPGAEGYLAELEAYYGEEIYDHDVGQKNYRIFLLMSKEKKLAGELASLMRERFQRQDGAEAQEGMLRGLQDLKQLCGRRACRQMKSFLYMDEGNGYQEEDKLEREALANASNEFHLCYQYQVGKKVTGFRFDPVEGCGCMMARVSICSDQGELPFSPVGGWEHGGYYVFPGDDPQFFIDAGGKQLEWLKIEADIILYPEERGLMFSIMDKIVSDSEQRAIDAIREKEAALYARADAVRDKERAEEDRDRMDKECQKAIELRNAMAKEKDEVLSLMAQEKDEALSLMAQEKDEALRIRDAMAVEKDEALQLRNAMAMERDESLRLRGAMAEEKDEALRLRDAMAREKDEALQLMLQEKEEAFRVRDALAIEKDEALRVRDALAIEKDAALRERDDVRAERDVLRSERDVAVQEREDMRNEYAQEKARADLYEGAYNNVIQSGSWKMTAPLRKLFGKGKE